MSSGPSGISQPQVSTSEKLSDRATPRTIVMVVGYVVAIVIAGIVWKTVDIIWAVVALIVLCALVFFFIKNFYDK